MLRIFMRFSFHAIYEQQRRPVGGAFPTPGSSPGTRLKAGYVRFPKNKIRAGRPSIDITACARVLAPGSHSGYASPIHAAGRPCGVLQERRRTFFDALRVP
jgi:hypothetical protein